MAIAPCWSDVRPAVAERPYLRGFPLIERKRMLRGIVRRGKCSGLMYVEHLDAHGRKLFESICRVDFEGIVAKRKDGIYSPDADAQWIKVKNQNYTQAEARRELFRLGVRRPICESGVWCIRAEC